MQIGEGAVIAERTGIVTFSDFRVADRALASGGDGQDFPAIQGKGAAALSHGFTQRCFPKREAKKGQGMKSLAGFGAAA